MANVFRSMPPLTFLLCASVPLWFSASSSGQQPPSYTKDIKPFLAKYCLECHGKKGKAELDVSTYESFLKGGISFPGFVPGKPNESFSVILVEHKSKPVMPPGKSKQPTPAEKGLLRAWIAAGAKNDSGGAKLELPEIKPRLRPPAAVAALAYRPDGKLLAAGGYKEVVLIDPLRAAVVATLPDQSAGVTALAFSRDGQRLAVASGTPGAAGELRLYGEIVLRLTTKPLWMTVAHGDIIHDLAFSPDGKLLASTGYDRSIKLWDVIPGERGVSPRQTLKDHSDSVYGLAFSPDGKLLASVAADRAVKVWDVATGTRLYTLSDATDWVYAVAWSPDGKHLAAAGVDKSIRVWEASANGARLVFSVFAHEGPVTRLVYAADGKTLYSLGDDRTIKAWDASRMVEKKVYDRQPETALALAVSSEQKQLAVGRFDGALVLLEEPTGKVQGQPLPVATRGAHATPLGGDRFAPEGKKPGNDTPATAQKIELPVTIVGTIDRAGAVDFYRFEAKAGQQVGVQALPGDAKTLDPVLQLSDATGKVVAEVADGLLGHTCDKAGAYVLSIRDRDYRGGGLSYRLNIGDVPVVTALYPAGVQRGARMDVHVAGVHLKTTGLVQVQVPADAAIGARVPVPVESPHGAVLGPSNVVVGEFPEVVSAPGSFPVRSFTPDGKCITHLPAKWSEAWVMPVPGTANGRLERPGEAHTWQFTAKKGQRLIVEVDARRLGSPLDSAIEVLDAKDQPVPRATLRCLGRTFTVLRDHDSAAPGIRMEAWNEFAVNDYVWIGSELLRIKALPRNPDDDCQFVAVNGQRVGQLDTTPTFQVLGAPLYRVALHPPGTTFPPNGFPVIPLYYRNDDGGPGYGKDSRLFFEPPADGAYRVRIGDARGQGGSQHFYRLTVRSPRPSFQVRFNPTAPAVWRGGAVPITVTADRSDGFNDAIELRLENLPPGFHAPATTIPAGETSTAFALFAEPQAVFVDKAPPLRLVARARIAERAGSRERPEIMIREVPGGLPQLVEPGDIVTTVNLHDVAVRPGKSVRLTVQIERRNGFKGRVPLDVRGLPHGVRVLDVGLNGILVTEQVASRTIEIYCEPWVEPTEHPIVVLARREGKNTEHAARSVLLRVVK